MEIIYQGCMVPDWIDDYPLNWETKSFDQYQDYLKLSKLRSYNNWVYKVRRLQVMVENDQPNCGCEEQCLCYTR